MSNTKTVMGQAANTLTVPLNVEDVFSTYLFESSNSVTPLTITNNIDLSTEGGMVWVKTRSAAEEFHQVTDTERGANKRLITDMTVAENAAANYDVVTQFNTDGFVYSDGYGATRNLASWTFRKAPKFFDVVTYTGDGTNPRTISHNLGGTVGHITVKPTSSSGSWWNFHRTLGAGKALSLNATDAVINSNNFWGGVEPTSTEFTVQFNNNAAGVEYVAYLFAHNDGDGGFNGGDIIKCGSYTGTGTNTPTWNDIDVGFEPQFVILKNVDYTTSDRYRSGWNIFDSMRGWTESSVSTLSAHSSDAEGQAAYCKLTPNGFSVANPNFNSTDTYIYIAIRRGTKVPESGTEVYSPDLLDISGVTNGDRFITTNFPVDLNMRLLRSPGSWVARVTDRIRGGSELYTNLTNAEGTAPSYSNNSYSFDDNLGVVNRSSDTNSYSNQLSYSWKRAPGFFDVVAYTGDGVAGRTVSHNLGVAPEMMWIKRRDSNAHWFVYHKDVSDPTKPMVLSLNNALGTATVFGTHTSSVFELDDTFYTNTSGATHIAYLFASLPGISKVGSYTGNGGTQTIDCGFTSGARFVLIKRTDSTGDWYVWDTERGIVAGNDPHLSLNSTAAEVTTNDSIDPVSSGFAVNQLAATNINVSAATYIFYAIA